MKKTVLTRMSKKKDRMMPVQAVRQDNFPFLLMKNQKELREEGEHNAVVNEKERLEVGRGLRGEKKSKGNYRAKDCEKLARVWIEQFRRRSKRETLCGKKL